MGLGSLKALQQTLSNSRKLPFPSILVNYTFENSQCFTLQTSCTVPSRSLVSCCVPFPSTGTLKVNVQLLPWLENSFWERQHSSECGHLLVHGLGRSWMSLPMRQLNRMEQKHDQQGPGLLWYLYVLLCDISRLLTVCHPTATHIQIALNSAVPATSLCINRQLYRVARMKTAGMTDVEKRRNLIYDLLIGIGIPVLQMIAGECA